MSNTHIFTHLRHLPRQLIVLFHLLAKSPELVPLRFGFIKAHSTEIRSRHGINYLGPLLSSDLAVLVQNAIIGFPVPQRNQSIEQASHVGNTSGQPEASA
jgi:hypothetical protein